ncbi:MAG: rhomboid family intramembrane serine protease [Solirubrobacteraceae bacterium]
MTPTSVGMRCPECARQRTKVHRVPRRAPGASFSGSLWHDPRTWSVTETLIAINVAVFLAEVATGVTFSGSDSGAVWYHGVLFGPFIAGHGEHQYWRLLTSGFLHESIWHIGINMLSLWWVGRVLEPAIGKAYFAAIYFTALLAGSFGVLLLTPDAATLGASGAIFGIFGALIMVAHARRIPLWSSGLMPVLILNLIITLTIPGVSIGGHAGGVLSGFFTGWLVTEYGEKRGRRNLVLLGCLAVAVASVIAAIAVAGDSGLLPGGSTI